MVDAWSQERKEAATAHDMPSHSPRFTIHTPTPPFPNQHLRNANQRPQDQRSQDQRPHEEATVSGEVLDVWAFHDALELPHGDMPALVEMPEGLEEAFRKMLEAARAADEASAAVTVSYVTPSTRYAG
jgi:hypothetical protein